MMEEELPILKKEKTLIQSSFVLSGFIDMPNSLLLPCKVYFYPHGRLFKFIIKSKKYNNNQSDDISLYNEYEVSFGVDDILGVSEPLVRPKAVRVKLYTFRKNNSNKEMVDGQSCGFNDNDNARIFSGQDLLVQETYKFHFNITPKQTIEDINKFLSLFKEIIYTDRPRKLVVLLNPYGGSREAKDIYQLLVKDMFDQANIEILYYETESSDHICDITATLDLQGVDGIVGIGGDGLINQIVNGLHSRSDIDLIKSIPIGHIPAGSQNALAISINGKKTIQEYAYAIIIGGTRKLDLIEVFFPEYNRRVYSLITVAYGFLGDVLEDSEKNRWMGPFRYQYCAVKHFFKNKSYRATIAYLPLDNDDQKDEGSIDKNPDWITLDDADLEMACAFNISGETNQNPEMVPAQCDDGFITMLLVKKFSPIRTFEYVINVFTESHLSLDCVQLVKTKSIKIVPDLSNSSPINIDGELQPTSTMLLKTKEKWASFYYLSKKLRD